MEVLHCGSRYFRLFCSCDLDLDTLATSYVSQNALKASAAAAASARKTIKYVQYPLSYSHMFFSSGGRDSLIGQLSDDAHSLIAEIGRRARLTLCTDDPRFYCAQVFPWQFSVSLPTRSQFRNFSSPHNIYIYIGLQICESTS